jgi:peroxiredoxin
MRHTLLTWGEPAPWFAARATNNPEYKFSSLGGCYVVLCFFQSATRSDSRQILSDIWNARAQFNDEDICFFGVSTDPEDERQERVRQNLPGMRFFWDFDESVSKQYGAVPDGAAPVEPASASAYRPHTLVLDPLLRVVAVLPFDDAPQTYVARLFKILAGLPPLAPPSLAAPQAPVLLVPNVFEPGLCRALIQYYETHGGEESGFMQEKNGMTVQAFDYGHKRRTDQEITDQKLRHSCMVRIHDRLLPVLHRAYQFQATRIERYIVACYDAAVQGHFRPHRDNTTKGTAHRRFAVSLHLNTGEYEGGYLRFPEFGRHQYIAPQGGAVVFSCSLLHEATAVTRGKRYMFLPFLYDEDAAKIREQNAVFLKDK